MSLGGAPIGAVLIGGGDSTGVVTLTGVTHASARATGRVGKAQVLVGTARASARAPSSHLGKAFQIQGHADAAARARPFMQRVIAIAGKGSAAARGTSSVSRQPGMVGIAKSAARASAPLVARGRPLSGAARAAARAPSTSTRAIPIAGRAAAASRSTARLGRARPLAGQGTAAARSFGQTATQPSLQAAAFAAAMVSPPPTLFVAHAGVAFARAASAATGILTRFPALASTASAVASAFGDLDTEFGGIPVGDRPLFAFDRTRRHLVVASRGRGRTVKHPKRRVALSARHTHAAARAVATLQVVERFADPPPMIAAAAAYGSLVKVSPLAARPATAARATGMLAAGTATAGVASAAARATGTLAASVPIVGEGNAAAGAFGLLLITQPTGGAVDLAARTGAAARARGTAPSGVALSGAARASSRATATVRAVAGMTGTSRASARAGPALATSLVQIASTARAASRVTATAVVDAPFVGSRSRAAARAVGLLRAGTTLVATHVPATARVYAQLSTSPVEALNGAARTSARARGTMTAAAGMSGKARTASRAKATLAATVKPSGKARSASRATGNLQAGLSVFMPANVDGSAAMQSFIDAQPDGTTIHLQPSKIYTAEFPLVIDQRHQLTIDMNGATIRQTDFAPYGAETTIAPSMNGLSWSSGTVSLLNATAIGSSGTVLVLSGGNIVRIKYTSKSGNSLLGCTRLTSTAGTFTTGDRVVDPTATGPGTDRNRSHLIIQRSTDIYIYNGFLQGCNPHAGAANDAYITELEAQHGIEIHSCTNLTLLGIAVNDIFGDFIYCNLYNDASPLTTNLIIQACAGARNGRQAITLMGINGAHMLNCNYGDSRMSMFDFETLTVANTLNGILIENNFFGPHRLMFLSATDTFADAMISNVSFLNNDANSVYNIIFGNSNIRKHDFWFIGNTTSAQASNPGGELIDFDNVDDIIVANNTQPLDPNRTPELYFVRGHNCGHHDLHGNNIAPQSIVFVGYFDMPIGGKARASSRVDATLGITSAPPVGDVRVTNDGSWRIVDGTPTYRTFTQTPNFDHRVTDSGRIRKTNTGQIRKVG